MNTQYRTFLSKDCNKEVFGPLFDRNPYHLKVGTGEHAYFTDTLALLIGSAYYLRIDLSRNIWSGQELYEFISTEIGDNDYRGAIETTEAQANLMIAYVATITTPIEAT